MFSISSCLNYAFCFSFYMIAVSRLKSRLIALFKKKEEISVVMITKSIVFNVILIIKRLIPPNGIAKYLLNRLHLLYKRCLHSIS